jgi:hypothetical protein
MLSNLPAMWFVARSSTRRASLLFIRKLSDWNQRGYDITNESLSFGDRPKVVLQVRLTMQHLLETSTSASSCSMRVIYLLLTISFLP